MATARDRPHSFRSALQAAREILGANLEVARKGSVETESEQLVLAAYRAGTGRAITRLELYSRIEDRLPERVGDLLLVMAGTRGEGKPLQHVVGYQYFLEHEYQVGPDVLIPRPETEVLVARALEDLRVSHPALGAEIGVGSGAISIELLSALPGLAMVASELVPAALERARSNARRILEAASARLELVPALGPLEVWEPLARSLRERADGREGAVAFDFVISNPPYLAARDPIEEEVRLHEPATALFAPEGDPLHFYRAIAEGAGSCLRSGGRAFLELAPERAEDTLAVFAAAGWGDVAVLPDLTGRSRVLVATYRGKG